MYQGFPLNKLQDEWNHRWIDKKWNNICEIQRDKHFVEFTQHCVYFILFHSDNTGLDMEFTATKRGQQKQIKDGYLHILQKNLANNFTPCEYVLRRKGHCKARAMPILMNRRIITRIHLVNPTVKLQK